MDPIHEQVARIAGNRWGLYVAKYPELAELAQHVNRNTIARCLVVQCRSFLRRDGGHLELFDNWVAAEDPGFRNLSRGDFRLKETLPLAAKIGWRPIPVDEIGLYLDAFRKKLPSKRGKDGSRKARRRPNRPALSSERGVTGRAGLGHRSGCPMSPRAPGIPLQAHQPLPASNCDGSENAWPRMRSISGLEISLEAGHIRRR